VWNNYYKETGLGSLETNGRLWPTYGPSGWGWMPEYLLSVWTSPTLWGRDRCLSARSSIDGVQSVFSPGYWVVQTVCGQDKMTRRMLGVATNCWSEFRSHWGELEMDWGPWA